ncbi:dienelactone hydrolase [Nocardia sp. GAS34]|uniref:alpha/beta hydrolase family protein n=1 Tax=unclassified Nocardia TaxID=2637762 RepID=UPI003D1F3C41
MIPTQDEAVAVATTVMELLRAERFSEIEELFAPRLAAAVSADTVRLGWMSETARIGSVRGLGAITTAPLHDELMLAKIPVNGDNSGIEVHISVDDAGRLHGFRLAPPSESDWTPPKYATPRRFTEREVTLGSGPHAVSGTLTLPKGDRPRPGVVLIASGPNNRDVTTGPNKPFKDLAWGLASRGVAVVRFDKIGHVHAGVENVPGYTMVEEYLPHALAGARLLREQPGVDRVYLAGHSGGGKAAVRAAAAEPSIAGVIIMAGDTVPLPRSIMRTIDYLTELEPDPAPEMKTVAEATARAAAATEDPGLSPDTPGSELLFGMPASYWLDMRAFDQVATAAALERPILILQGGRDYQVTLAEDLAGWRAGLAGHPDTTIRILEADDHMFFRGSGRSTPADYQAPQHVDPEAVAAIADWLAPARDRGRIARLLNHLAR